MKAALAVLVLACAMVVAYGGLICGSKYCKDHPCTVPVAQSSCRAPAVYRPNHAGQCGCCPACVTLLPENAPCKTYSKELGETPSAVCREPLKCINSVCIKAQVPRNKA